MRSSDEADDAVCIVSKDTKNELMEIEELQDCLSFHNWIWTAAADARKAEITALPAESTASVESESGTRKMRLKESSPKQSPGLKKEGK